MMQWIMLISLLFEIAKFLDEPVRKQKRQEWFDDLSTAFQSKRNPIEFIILLLNNSASFADAFDKWKKNTVLSDV